MEIDLLKRNTGVISNIMDISMIINSIYKITDKTTKNISIDKDKSFTLIKNYLTGNTPECIEDYEKDGDRWAKFQLEQLKEKGLLKNINQITYFNINSYIKIIDYIDNIFSVEIKKLTKSLEKNYTDQTYFSVSRIINDVSPKSNFLGITYRIIDSNQNQILKVKISPYFNEYTQKYEIGISFTPKQAQHTFTIQTYRDTISYLKDFFECTIFSTMTIKYYQVLNKFFPDGLDKNRIFYEKDIETLQTYIHDMNDIYKCDLYLDDKGLIKINKNKFNVSNIIKYVPPISSYVYYL